MGSLWRQVLLQQALDRWRGRSRTMDPLLELEDRRVHLSLARSLRLQLVRIPAGRSNMQPVEGQRWRVSASRVVQRLVQAVFAEGRVAA